MSADGHPPTATPDPTRRESWMARANAIMPPWEDLTEDERELWRAGVRRARARAVARHAERVHPLHPLGPVPLGESWASQWRWDGLEESEREWLRSSRRSARRRSLAAIGLGTGLLTLAGWLIVSARRRG